MILRNSSVHNISIGDFGANLSKANAVSKILVEFMEAFALVPKVCFLILRSFTDDDTRVNF